MCLVSAGARNYIFEALKESDSIYAGMEEEGVLVKNIGIHFAGLFDTVSSHGPSFSNDTRTLKLDTIRKAKQVVHLVAAEEHRKNFSLTDIASTGNKGRELFLPGVHSDIGGGYREGASEDQGIYWTMESLHVSESWQHPDQTWRLGGSASSPASSFANQASVSSSVRCGLFIKFDRCRHTETLIITR